MTSTPKQSTRRTSPRGEKRGPKPLTPEEEAEIRQMVLRLVEAVGKRANRL